MMKLKFTLFVTLILLAAFFIPMGSASAQEDKGVITVPTLLAPRLTISLTTPTYKWSKISAATQYQLQVYQGSTKKVDTNVSSSYCTTSCKVTPSTVLSYSTFKWRIRAYLSGSWQAWTAYTYFIVSPAFNAQFNGNANGWASNGGSWYIGTEYIYTSGVSSGYSSNVYRYVTTYSNFDFSARVRHPTGTLAAGLAVRMGTNLGTNSYWYPGYMFYYTNDGRFAIYRRYGDGASTALVSYTSTSVIVPYDWNILRVIAVGPTFHFYINGNLVASVTDVNYASGYVGFTMYSEQTTDSFQVDWARLNPLDASFRVTDTISPEQQALNTAAAHTGSKISENGE
jgi:hypothetical protein